MRVQLWYQSFSFNSHSDESDCEQLLSKIQSFVACGMNSQQAESETAPGLAVIKHSNSGKEQRWQVSIMTKRCLAMLDNV